jgi:hypothetical protein
VPQLVAERSEFIADVKALLPQLEAALKRPSTDKKKAKAVDELAEKLKKASTALEATQLYTYIQVALKASGQEEPVQALAKILEPALKAKKFDVVKQQLLAPEYTKIMRTHYASMAESLTFALSHLYADTTLPADAQLALGLLNQQVQKQVLSGADAQAIALGGGVNVQFADLLEQHAALKTKVQQQLALIGIPPADVDTVAKQSVGFLQAFEAAKVSNTNPSALMLKDVAEELDRLFLGLNGQGSSLQTALTVSKQAFNASPEKKMALLALLRHQSTAIEAGVKTFDKAYKGNKKVTLAQQTQLKNALLTALWANPEKAKVSQAIALAQASWWGKLRSAWMPF